MVYISLHVWVFHLSRESVRSFYALHSPEDSSVVPTTTSCENQAAYHQCNLFRTEKLSIQSTLVYVRLQYLSDPSIRRTLIFVEHYYPSDLRIYETHQPTHEFPCNSVYLASRMSIPSLARIRMLLLRIDFHTEPKTLASYRLSPNTRNKQPIINATSFWQRSSVSTGPCYTSSLCIQQVPLPAMSQHLSDPRIYGAHQPTHGFLCNSILPASLVDIPSSCAYPFAPSPRRFINHLNILAPYLLSLLTRNKQFTLNKPLLDR